MIRLGTSDDFDSVFTMLNTHAQEINSDKNLFGYSAEKITNVAEQFLANHLCFIYAQEQHGSLVDYGALVLSTVEPWFGDREILNCEWFYVKPEGRYTRAAFKLLKAAKDTAAANSRNMLMSISSLERPLVKGKLLNKFGFVNLGGNYILEVA